MGNLVTAIYENGVLRPLTPLALPEHAQVEISVQSVSAPADNLEYRREVRAVLVAAGLSLPPDALPPVNPLSAEQRAELARRFSAERPLSELLAEEREGR